MKTCLEWLIMLVWACLFGPLFLAGMLLSSTGHVLLRVTRWSSMRATLLAERLYSRGRP